MQHQLQPMCIDDYDVVLAPWQSSEGEGLSDLGRNRDGAAFWERIGWHRRDDLVLLQTVVPPVE